MNEKHERKSEEKLFFVVDIFFSLLIHERQSKGEKAKDKQKLESTPKQMREGKKIANQKAKKTDSD